MSEVLISSMNGAAFIAENRQPNFCCGNPSCKAPHASRRDRTKLVPASACCALALVQSLGWSTKATDGLFFCKKCVVAADRMKATSSPPLLSQVPPESNESLASLSKILSLPNLPEVLSKPTALPPVEQFFDASPNEEDAMDLDSASFHSAEEGSDDWIDTGEPDFLDPSSPSLSPSTPFSPNQDQNFPHETPLDTLASAALPLGSLLPSHSAAESSRSVATSPISELLSPDHEWRNGQSHQNPVSSRILTHIVDRIEPARKTALKAGQEAILVQVPTDRRRPASLVSFAKEVPKKKLRVEAKELQQVLSSSGVSEILVTEMPCVRKKIKKEKTKEHRRAYRSGVRKSTSTLQKQLDERAGELQFGVSFSQRDLRLTNKMTFYHSKPPSPEDRTKLISIDDEDAPDVTIPFEWADHPVVNQIIDRAKELRLAFENPGHRQPPVEGAKWQKLGEEVARQHNLTKSLSAAGAVCKQLCLRNGLFVEHTFHNRSERISVGAGVKSAHYRPEKRKENFEKCVRDVYAGAVFEEEDIVFLERDPRKIFEKKLQELAAQGKICPPAGVSEFTVDALAWGDSSNKHAKNIYATTLNLIHNARYFPVDAATLVEKEILYQVGVQLKEDRDVVTLLDRRLAKSIAKDFRAPFEVSSGGVVFRIFVRFRGTAKDMKSWWLSEGNKASASAIHSCPICNSPLHEFHECRPPDRAKSLATILDDLQLGRSDTGISHVPGLLGDDLRTLLSDRLLDFFEFFPQPLHTLSNLSKTVRDLLKSKSFLSESEFKAIQAAELQTLHRDQSLDAVGWWREFRKSLANAETTHFPFIKNPALRYLVQLMSDLCRIAYTDRDRGDNSRVRTYVEWAVTTFSMGSVLYWVSGKENLDHYTHMAVNLELALSLRNGIPLMSLMGESKEGLWKRFKDYLGLTSRRDGEKEVAQQAKTLAVRFLMSEVVKEKFDSTRCSHDIEKPQVDRNQLVPLFYHTALTTKGQITFSPKLITFLLTFADISDWWSFEESSFSLRFKTSTTNPFAPTGNEALLSMEEGAKRFSQIQRAVQTKSGPYPADPVPTQRKLDVIVRLNEILAKISVASGFQAVPLVMSADWPIHPVIRQNLFFAYRDASHISGFPHNLASIRHGKPLPGPNDLFCAIPSNVLLRCSDGSVVNANTCCLQGRIPATVEPQVCQTLPAQSSLPQQPSPPKKTRKSAKVTDKGAVGRVITRGRGKQ